MRLVQAKYSQKTVRTEKEGYGKAPDETVPLEKSLGSPRGILDPGRG